MFHPETAENLVRKSGFLQISRNKHMIYAGKHLPEMRFYCDFPTSGFSSTSKVRIDVIGVVFGPPGPHARPRNSPGTLASALTISIYGYINMKYSIGCIMN